MSKFAALFGRRVLWIGLVGALVPLAVLLGLQTWWLFKLERTSIVAGNAALTGFLDAVTSELVFAYGTGAEHALDVSSGIFVEGRLDSAAAHFRRTDLGGARRLFVVRFSHETWGKILFYDPESESMFVPEPSDETRAITVACAPWKLMHSKAVKVDSARLVVEERDFANRIVLNPITDGTSRLVGVVGMILDVDHLVERQIPNAIRASLDDFFPGGGADEVVVSLRDAAGRLRFSTDPKDEGEPDLTRPFSFVLTDHTLGIRSRELTPEQLARVSLVSNAALSVVAAALLIGGLALVLRTTAREMRLSRMKSDFVSNVSHELRTPLASIRVFGELLRLGRARSPEKVREYGAHIETESRRLTQLVNNILDFAKIESGARSYRLQPGDVGQVLEAALGMFEVRRKHQGLDIDYERTAEPLPSVRIDADALGQALHNLLDNAAKYSGETGWIGVQLTRRAGEVVVSIADRGTGIPKSDQSRVFERFQRADTGLVHNVKGSGLGLSIVRHVVEAHGGRITLESAPGRGSVFSIHLPIEEGPRSEPDTPSSAR